MADQKTTRDRSFSRGSVVSVLLALLAAGTVATVAVTLSSRPAAVPARPVKLPLTRQIPSGEIRGALAAAGISPRVLAAAGATGPDAAAVVANTRQYLLDNGGELSGAMDALGAANADFDRLSQLVQQGKVTRSENVDYPTAKAQLVAACEAARTSQANARAAFDTATAAIRTAALSGLSDAQRARFGTIHGNARWKLPVQYLAVDRTEREWVELREALTNRRTALRNGGTTDALAQSRLTAADAASPTVAANQSLAANLSAVQTAFDQALGTR